MSHFIIMTSKSYMRYVITLRTLSIYKQYSLHSMCGRISEVIDTLTHTPNIYPTLATYARKWSIGRKYT